MPDQKRVDIAILRNAVKLPVEIKGQWNRTVWDDANVQLGDRYAIDGQAKGRGVYIVLWFGDVLRKNLPKHPDGLPRTQHTRRTGTDAGRPVAGGPAPVDRHLRHRPQPNQPGAA